MGTLFCGGFWFLSVQLLLYERKILSTFEKLFIVYPKRVVFGGCTFFSEPNKYSRQYLNIYEVHINVIKNSVNFKLKIMKI